MTTAKRWFTATREDENVAFVAETAAGHDGGRAQFLPRIRTLATDILLPLVQHHRHLIEEIGAIRIGEEVWRGGNLPRGFVEYRSRIADPGAP
jgi:hypothetical protein